ncbi:MAG TPA: LPS-assembly protein LptD [Noviherbaspirillum sp.]|nr:LPS-assembly protein LptD [Noviherbaspirillum sp.]
MTRLPASIPLRPLIRVLAAALAAFSVPGVASAQPPEQEAPTVVSAERMTGRPDIEVILEGDVEIERGPTTVFADHATYDIVEDEVHAIGNIRLLRMGDTYTGDELRMRIAAGRGFVSQPTYSLQRNQGHGTASRIVFDSRERATVYEGTYSTCEGPDPDWYLRSSRLALDQERDEGVGFGTWLYFKNVPIMALPVMSFPLSEERRSGVLPPSIGTTNRGGVELTVPYYFNIAPNRDLTLYPKVYGRRGLQLGVEARYLEPDFHGETRIEGLPNDRVTGTSRYALTSTHSQRFGSRWSFGWNLNHASDDDYPSDFARTQTAASQRLLLRDTHLAYGGNGWGATLRASGYQVLQDPLAPIARPYDRLPQLNLYAGRSNIGGYDWHADSELTRFWHPDQVRGERLVFNPRISYPFIRPGYFLTPRLALHASAYRVGLPGVVDNVSLTRVLPTASLDGGLIFERDAQFFGEAMTQTLEPRLFYVYTPYRDQSAFPLFDTAEADVSFAQLFSENRFVGHDRIADANHITAAVVNRLLDTEGGERLRVAVGQRYYLTPQRVALGAVPPPGRSDILAAVYGRLTQTVTVEANVQYSQLQGRVARSNYGVRYQPGPLRVLNLQYRQDRANNLEQIDLSAQWPIASRWYGVGRINYSLPDQRLAETLAGFEYKHDCWIFRFVAQRTPTATREATTSFFLQLELIGLTRLGSNPIEALRTNIPGYQLVN